MTEVEALQATRVAHHLLICALIQTHPRHGQMQIHLTRLLEQQLGNGSLGKPLTPEQQEAVRETVEWTQTLRPVTG